MRCKCDIDPSCAYCSFICFSIYKYMDRKCRPYAVETGIYQHCGRGCSRICAHIDVRAEGTEEGARVSTSQHSCVSWRVCFVLICMYDSGYWQWPTGKKGPWVQIPFTLLLLVLLLCINSAFAPASIFFAKKALNSWHAKLCDRARTQRPRRRRSSS